MKLCTYYGFRIVWFIVLAGACISTISAQADSESKRKKEPQISLQVAACIEEPGTTYAFIATNNGTNDLVTRPICQNQHYILITEPGRNKGPVTMWGYRDPPSVVIRPSETKTWKVNLDEWCDFRRKGIYKLQWHLEGILSDEFLILQETERETKKARRQRDAR